MKEKKLVCEEDRGTLREWLTRRLTALRRQTKRAGEATEAAYSEGGELEIIFAFDELLGEQPPEPLRRKPRAH